MGPWEIVASVFCAVMGTVLGVLPFLKEYQATVKLAEAEGLATVVGQIEKVEEIAALIGGSTARWQTVQEAAGKTAGTAKEIADKMAAEVKAFNEFLQRANDGEKAALRLEIDKLRRVETEWLQVLVRMLDHVYALHRASLESRQPTLIEQLANFQSACRDAARRVGLMPLVATPAEIFDERRHQLMDGEPRPAADAAVEETIASGYTFQGKLIRPVLVRLRNGNGHGLEGKGDPAADSAPETGVDQRQLPLEPQKSDSI